MGIVWTSSGMPLHFGSRVSWEKFLSTSTEGNLLMHMTETIYSPSLPVSAVLNYMSRLREEAEKV